MKIVFASITKNTRKPISCPTYVDYTGEESIVAFCQREGKKPHLFKQYLTISQYVILDNGGKNN